MKCKVRETTNRGFPFDCDWCKKRFIYNQERYKFISMGKAEIVIHNDCYDEFVKELKEFAETL